MSFKHLAVVALLGLSVGNLASATVILDKYNADCSAKVDPAQAVVVASFKSLCGTGDVTELYKSDFVTGFALGSDSGTFKDSYNTTFGGFESELEDPSTALIKYVLGQPAISGFERVFLLAKDGRQDPSYYGWDITGWNGLEDLSITAWKNSPGAISNLTIWGGGRVSVPEPGTLGLLGLGLVAVGLMRRKIVR